MKSETDVPRESPAFLGISNIVIVGYFLNSKSLARQLHRAFSAVEHNLIFDISSITPFLISMIDAFVLVLTVDQRLTYLSFFHTVDCFWRELRFHCSMEFVGGNVNGLRKVLGELWRYVVCIG